MYSSNSQDYLYISTSNSNSRSQSRRNQIPPPQYDYGIDISGMAPPMIPDTAESIQRDFDRYMRETSGSKPPGHLNSHGRSAGMAPSHGAYVNTSGMAPPMIPDTAESIQRDFDRYMRETSGSQRPGHLHSHGRYAGMAPSHGAYVNASGMAPPMIPDTAESIQRDFDRYMRESGAPLPLPPRIQSSTASVPHSNGAYGVGNNVTMAPSPHNHVQDTAVQRQYPRDAGSKTSRSNHVQSPTPATHSKGANVHISKPRVPGTQKTAEYVQLEREFEQYMRETAPPALSPSPTPTNYTLVPQEAFSRPTSILIPPIDFTPKGWHVMGVNLPYRMSEKQDIEGARERVFVPTQGMREIIVKIQWPGYIHERYTFEMRIETKEGNVTRGELRDLVCGAVIEFSMLLKRRNAYVAKGYTKWTIGKTGLNVDKFFVARLLHRGGNYFQPEIWVPTPREK